MKLQKIFELVDNRYISFVCGFCMMGAAGTEYMFSTYAPQLKTLMGYTQTEINFLGTCGNMGIYLGFYMGIIHDFSNARFVSLLGAILLFLGWFLLFLGSIQFFPTSYLVMGLFMYIQGNGSAACYTAAISNNVPKFSGKARGTVVGLLVSMFGLTSAIFSPIYSHVFDSHVESFLLFFSLTLPFIALSGFFFLAPVKATKEETEIIYVDDNGKMLRENDALLSKSSHSYSPTNDKFDDHDHDRQIDLANDDHNNNDNNSGDGKEVLIKAELNSLQIFRSLDFYILFFVFMMGTGVGLTLFNNLGSLVIAMGGEEASWLVTILSLCNCGGRLLFGLFSDLAVRMPTAWSSRSTCLFIGLGLMAFSQVYFVCATLPGFADNHIGWLIPGVVFLGLSYGALMSLVPAMVNEFLGIKYFGGNWGIVRASPAFSSLLLSTLVAGVLYEMNITDANSEDCFGWACFGYTFLINYGVVIISMIGCFWLMLRWTIFEENSRRNYSFA